MMHPVEIEQTLDSMTILVDTRERPTEYSEKRYAQFGRPYRREKLNVGDYSAEFVTPAGEVISLKDSVVVERKNSIDELCMCYTSERGRFEREFERAKDGGIKVYLLVENATFESIYNGKYRSRMTPNALVASILAWLARYDCQIIFCKAETSGKIIHDILYYEMRERLNEQSE
jgi:ERCC4-type nuclease